MDRQLILGQGQEINNMGLKKKDRKRKTESWRKEGETRIG